MEPEQIADALDDAADYIERNGWYSPNKQESRGPRPACASNAIRAALNVDENHGAVPLMLGANQALASVIDSDDPNYFYAIFRWNDAPDRTKQQVLDVMRAAAKQQRGLS